MAKEMKIVFFGAGAVGATVGGWIAPVNDKTYFLDQGEIADALKNNGITTYLEGHSDEAKNIDVKVIDSIDEIENPDLVVISVKTYSLDKVSQIIKDALGGDTLVLALQNGRDNQDILPKYFSRVIYGVVCYNAWLDEPGVAGFQKHGPLVIGTPDNSLMTEMKDIAKLFSRGVETVVTEHLQDAVYSKMIINLTNSLTTLVGHKFRHISSPALFQKLLSNLTYEGVQIVKAAGYNECKLGGMPSWMLLEASSKLPRDLTKGLFNKNVKKMVVSSMAQDIIQRGGSDSELEALNGHFVKLAEELGVPAPYNKTVYELCKERFSAGKFSPMREREVWYRVKENL